MSLSDVMAHAGLTFYAEVALIIAMVAFIGIVVWVFARRNKERYERAKRMPLEDDKPQEPRGSARESAPKTDGGKDE